MSAIKGQTGCIVATAAVPSSVHVATMADRDDHHHQALMLQEANRAIVADSIRPEAGSLVAQALAELTWVTARGDAQLKVFNDAMPDRFIQSIELADRVLLELNRPGQGPSSPRRA